MATAQAPAQASLVESTTDFSKMSMEQIQALIEKATAAKADLYNKERAPILALVKEHIGTYNFTAAELGIKSAVAASPAPSTNEAADQTTPKKNSRHIKYGSEEFTWMKSLADAPLAAITSALQAGKSVKEFILHPEKADVNLMLVEKMEKIALEGNKPAKLSDAHLAELHLERAANGKVIPALKDGKIAVKYRNPETGQTWTGRGIKPKWIADAKNPGQFAVGGATAPAATTAKADTKAAAPATAKAA